MEYGVDYIGVFAAAICFDSEGNFLMGKRSSQARDRHGKWDFPGGKIEWGESFVAAVTREVIEECGTAPTDVRLLEVKEFIERGMHYYGFYCGANIDRSQVQITEPVYDELGWFTLETLPDGVTEEERTHIKRFLAKM